jgi:hypothetical protein
MLLPPSAHRTTACHQQPFRFSCSSRTGAVACRSEHHCSQRYPCSSARPLRRGPQACDPRIIKVSDLLLWDRNRYTGTLVGPQFTELMDKKMKFKHDKDNDAFGLVWRSSTAIQCSTIRVEIQTVRPIMARFPEEHFTIICLSNMPLGDCRRSDARSAGSSPLLGQAVEIAPESRANRK